MVKRPHIKIRWITSNDAGGEARYYPYHVQERRAELLVFTGQWDAAERLMLETLDCTGGQAARRIRSSSLLDLGHLYMIRNEYQRSLDHLDRVLELAREDGDRPNQVRAYSAAAGAYWRMGEFDRALEQYGRMHEMAAAAGDRHNMAVALSNIGTIHQNRGDLTTALDHYHRAQSIFIEMGDVYRQSQLIGSIGVVHYNQGDFPAALACYQEKLRIAAQLGDGVSLAYGFGSIAMVYADTGQVDRALEYHDRAIRLSRQYGDERSVAVNLGNLGCLYKMLGGYDVSLAHFEQAVAIGERLGIKYYLADFYYHQADVRYRRGEYQMAAAANERSAALAAELKLADDHLKTQILKAKISVKTATNETGRREGLCCLEQALTATANPEIRAEVRFDLWALYAELSHTVESGRFLQEALEDYRRLLDKTPKQEYRDRLAALERGSIMPDPAGPAGA